SRCCRCPLPPSGWRGPMSCRCCRRPYRRRHRRLRCGGMPRVSPGFSALLVKCYGVALSEGQTVPITPLRIATRGSAMALHQAALVRDRFAASHPGLAAELLTIRTTGDRVQTRLLSEIGGKGLFTKEIEEALLDGRIDLAVHSLKDMETVLPPGLVIGAVLPRDDPRDALVARDGAGLAHLPA